MKSDEFCASALELSLSLSHSLPPSFSQEQSRTVRSERLSSTQQASAVFHEAENSAV